MLQSQWWAVHVSLHPHLDGRLQHGPELFLGEVIDVEEVMPPGWGIHPHTSVGLCFLQDCTGSDMYLSASPASDQAPLQGGLGAIELVELLFTQSRGPAGEP